MRNRGTTLVSVMITTCIVGLAIVPMASLLLTESKQTRNNRNRVFAVHLARNMLERIRMEKLEPLSMLLATEEDGKIFVCADELLSATDLPEDYQAMCKAFQRSLVYKAAVDGDSAKGVLEAIVRWKEGTHQREFRLSTLITEEKLGGVR